MKYLLFVALLCVTACNQSDKTPTESSAEAKRRNIIPEPRKLIIPANAPYKNYTVERHSRGRFEERHDTLQVREISLDTAKVFFYGKEELDTLVIGREAVDYRTKRVFGHGHTTFIREKTFIHKGKPILIKKNNFFAPHQLFDIYTNESIGLVLMQIYPHPYGKEFFVLYNKDTYEELQNTIIKDTVFTKFSVE